MKSADGKNRWRDFIERFVVRFSYTMTPYHCFFLFTFIRFFGGASWLKVNVRIYSYKDKVKDYNFGSLIRTDARDEYGESNTIFGILILFFHFVLLN